MTEREIQNHIKKRLTELGITFFSTSANRKSKNSKGTPDLFVHIAAGARYIGCEIKGTDTPLSKEQVTLHKESKIYIFRDPDYAITVILAMRNKWK